jgi:hypothetical protein
MIKALAHSTTSWGPGDRVTKSRTTDASDDPTIFCTPTSLDPPTNPVGLHLSFIQETPRWPSDTPMTTPRDSRRP